jgi:hypothetical protein
MWTNGCEIVMVIMLLLLFCLFAQVYKGSWFYVTNAAFLFELQYLHGVFYVDNNIIKRMTFKFEIIATIWLNNNDRTHNNTQQQENNKDHLIKKRIKIHHRAYSTNTPSTIQVPNLSYQRA